MLVLSALVLVAVVFILMGRFALRATARVHPLYSLLAGGAVWVLLAQVTVAGIAFDVLWGGYVLLLLVFALFAVRLHRVERFAFMPPGQMPKHVAISGIILALLAPVCLWAVNDAPTQWDEFTHYMRNAFHLFDYKSVYDADYIKRWAVQHPSFPIGTLLFWQPVHEVMLAFTPQVFALGNLLLLVLVGSLMVHALEIKLRWSNVGLVAVTTLLGLTLLNPFQDTKLLLSAYADFPLAVFLFAASLPLLRAVPLPQGAHIMPYALSLLLVVLAKPIGIVFAAFVLGWWLLRLWAEKRRDFLGYAVLLLLPAGAYVHWQLFLGVQGIGELYGLPGQKSVNWEILQPMLLSMGHVFMQKSGMTLVLLGVFGAAMWHMLRVRRLDNLREVLKVQGIFLFPAVLSVYYIFGLGWAYLSEFPLAMGANAQSFWRFMGHLQFILLLPVAQVLLVLYRNSKMENLCYRNPWGIAAALGALFVAVIIINEPRLNRTPVAPLQHVAEVGHFLRQDVPYGSIILAVDSSQTGDLYAHVLGYHLAAHAVVTPVTQQVLEYGLPQEGLLWVHTPAALPQLAPLYDHSTSYLFTLRDGDIVTAQPFRHPSYQMPYLK